MSIPLKVLCDTGAACRTCRSRWQVVFRQTLKPAYAVPDDWPEFVCPRGLPWIEERTPIEQEAIVEICRDCPNGVLREFDAPACKVLSSGCCQGELAGIIRIGAGCVGIPQRFPDSESIVRFNAAYALAFPSRA